MALLKLQTRIVYEAAAPTGTGLEWLTVGSILVPAVLLVVLVYLGAEETV